MMKLYFLLSLLFANQGSTDIALQQVEEDQVQSTEVTWLSSDNNILLNRYPYYAHSSSYQRGQFAKNVHDGSERKTWLLDSNIKSGWVDTSIGLPQTIDKIIVIESGKRITQFKLKVYDGSKWILIAEGKQLLRKVFHFSPTLMSSIKIEIESLGGGGIAEIEAYNSQLKTNIISEKNIANILNNRVAIQLGSPLAFTKEGSRYINKRSHEVRPLPSKGQYFIDTLQFLVQQLSGTSNYHEEHQLLEGMLYEKKFSYKLPELIKLDNSKKVYEAYRDFFHSLNVSYRFPSDHPTLILAGKNINELNQQTLHFISKTLSNSKNTPSLKPVISNNIDLKLQPTPQLVGKTLPWVGARVGNINEHTNQAAWLKYFQPNAVRTWYGYSIMRSYIKMPEEIIQDSQTFENYKKSIRQNPDSSPFILWNKLLSSTLHRKTQYEFKVYKDLCIEVINQTGPKDWQNNWHQHSRNWLITYLSTYYLAKYYNVQVHQFGNEPDSYLDKFPDDQIAFRLHLIGDAIRSAIEDVNRIHHKELQASYSAPVLASNPRSRVAKVMMRNQYKNYKGEDTTLKNVQYYNRHRYNNRSRQNVLEIHQVDQMMKKESPDGLALLQVFTELNFSTGGNWNRPHITFTNDSPQVIQSMAAIWGSMMATQKVHGIFLFKLNALNDRWSNTVCSEFVKESDDGPAYFPAKSNDKTEIGYVSKNAEILRLFSEGFSGTQDLLKTNLDCPDLHYQAYTAYHPSHETYYIWSVQVNDKDDYTIELNLKKLNIPKNTVIQIKEVSASRFGEIVFQQPLPSNQKITFKQPKESVCLISFSKKAPEKIKNYTPTADSTIRQGLYKNQNFGGEEHLSVQRHPNSDHNKISFLKFKLEGDTSKIKKATLRLSGKRLSPFNYNDMFTFRVYGTHDIKWTEANLKAHNAPMIHQSVSSIQFGSTNQTNPPLGHMSFHNHFSDSEIDITNYIKENSNKEVGFILIRELKWPNENTEFSHVELISKEGELQHRPRLQIVY